MTTFGGQKIQKRFKKPLDRAERSKYLAMEPAPPHPLLAAGNAMYQTLSLQNRIVLSKAGYVKCSDVYEMDWRGVQHFWDGDVPRVRLARLDTSSMEALLHAVHTMAAYRPGYQLGSGIPVQRSLSVGAINTHQARVQPPPGQSRPSQQRQATSITSKHASPHASNSIQRMPPTVRYTDDRQPLLPQHRRSAGSPSSGGRKSFIVWLWEMLRSTWLVRFLRWLGLLLHLLQE
jgi:hypothetical protein